MYSAMTALAAAVALVATCSGAQADGGPVAGIEIGPEYETRVRMGIEQNRKSGAAVEVVDAGGRKIAGAAVSVRQVSHDFLFGCAFPAWTGVPKHLGEDGWENWNKYFTRIFNYATSENALKWGPLEREEGTYRWEGGDFMVSWCRERDIRIKGHTLIWPYANKGHGFPTWLQNHTPEKVHQLAKRHIGTVIGRYKDDIRIWDVVNEPIHLDWFAKNWDKDYEIYAYKWAREADPKATLVINDYAGFRGDHRRFVPHVRDLLEKGAPIDAIGEQAHDPPHWYSPREIFTTLDSMASTGLPIHITELTYPSNEADITGGFAQGKWTEEKQGEFYRYFMTLVFSHPKVEAITLWAMWDGSSWLKPGGVIRQDWTPKPAYHALDELINEKWKTRLEARSDTNGEVKFRGFHGDYEVTVTTTGGKATTQRFHLGKGPENRLRVAVE